MCDWNACYAVTVICNETEDTCEDCLAHLR